MQGALQIKQIVGANILRSRQGKQWTRRELARRLSVEQTLIYKWERGINRPDDGNLSNLAAVFGQEVAWFFTDHDDDQVAA